jgi:hypothetical protein
MKKLIIGVLAVGAALALRPVVKRRAVVKRRMVQKMREHCKQMMSQFAGSSETTAHETMGPEATPQKMHEHCEQIAARHEERKEPVGTA